MPEEDQPNYRSHSVAAFLYLGLAGLLLSTSFHPPSLADINQMLNAAAGSRDNVNGPSPSMQGIDPTTIAIAQAHRISEEDVDSLLVTETNPARGDGTMDFARCAALHNYIVQYGWLADGNRTLEDLPRTTHWEAHHEEFAADGHRMHPSLQEFFKLALKNEDVSFHFWVYGLFGPDHMFESQSFPENVEGEDLDRVVTLYAGSGQAGHSAGLMYDQERHQAYYAISIWEHDWASPIGEQLDLWHPLEAVLSNWVEMARVGKMNRLAG